MGSAVSFSHNDAGEKECCGEETGVNAVNNLFPKTGSETEWNAAYYRLEDYLRALRIVNRVRQSQIILEALEGAARQHAVNPECNPTELTMMEARGAIRRWLERLLARGERVEVAGWLALLATDAPNQWSSEFLSDEISPSFQRAIRESDITGGPAMQVTSMIPRPVNQNPARDAVNFSTLWTRLRQNLGWLAAWW